MEEAFEAADEGTDRKVVHPDDLLHFHKIWDDQTLNVLPNILSLNQPLGALVQKETWESLANAAAGKSSLKSILTCYFEPK